MKPSLVDAFTFATELDVLEFRLELLSPVVDRFVLVEATRTHSGVSKPLLFAENRERFAPYLSQIEHVVVEDLPPPLPDRWTPENFQRNAILRGLTDLAPTDLVIIGDVDEVPDPAILRELVETDHLPDRITLELRACYFRPNWESSATWPKLRLARRRAFESPQELRDSDPTFTVREAGAHFSYLMTPEGIGRKRGWIAEGSPATDRSEAHIRQEMALGVMASIGTLLEVRDRDQLGRVQRDLLDRHPETFDFRPLPSRTLRRAFRKFAHQRTLHRIPTPASNAFDRVIEAWVSRRAALTWPTPRPGEDRTDGTTNQR